MAERKYDIVLFGATGFTGKLTAKYLVENEQNFGNKQQKLKFAIAGRDQQKLNQVNETLAHKVDTIIADVQDQASLERMCEQTAIVMSSAGPFQKYGEPVVKACVTKGAHYLDITGEPGYINSIISKYHEEAKQKGVKLIPCCGFDSIPADLGVLYTLQQLPQSADYWDPNEEDNKGITLFADDKKKVKAEKPFVTVEGMLSVTAPGGPSGGTYTTLINSLGSAKKDASDSKRTEAKEPKSKQPKLISVRPRFAKPVNNYIVPLPTSDPLIVRRSISLADFSLGGLRYVEYGNFVQISTLFKTILFILSTIVFFILCQFKLGRKFLEWAYRKSGEGPSEEDMKKSHFVFTFNCKARSYQGDHHVITSVSGGEPGYLETSLMFAESALCLLENLSSASATPSGVVTPATVLGTKLISRLQKTGHIKFFTKRHSFERNDQIAQKDSIEREIKKYVYMK